MKKTYLILTFLLCASALATQEVSFNEAIKLTLDQNPDLGAIRLQEESSKLKSDQALAPNNPVVTYTRNNVSGLDPSAPSASDTVNIGLTIAFPGKSLAQSHIYQDNALSFHETALAKEVELFISLSNNYVALSANQKLRVLLKDESQRAKELLQLSEKKYGLGQGTQVDVLNARVFVANLEHDMVVLEGELKNLNNQFLTIIKKPESFDYIPKIPKEIIVPKLNRSMAELTQIMLKNRHPLKSAEYQVKSADSSLTQASLAWLPDFQLGMGLNTFNNPAAAAIPGQFRDYQFSIGIAIPLFFPLSELSGMRAARRDLEAARYQEESLRQNAILDLRTNYGKFESASSQLDNLTNLVLPASKASYDLTVKAYAAGRADYLRLNDARKNHIDAQKDFIAHLTDKATLYNQIIQQVGCDISEKEGPHACL